jgi:voltage-gated potassium channel Kch
MQGFPSSMPGAFGLMLYLSLVTITTVGYGETVPLTAIARLLVGLEATVGIVLLGSLINVICQAQ